MDRYITQYDYTTPWGVALRILARDGTSDHNTIISAIKEDEYQIQRLGKRGIAIDLGAHIGTVTLALLAKGFNVYAAEMLPENINILMANLLINNYHNRAKVYPVAITGKPVADVAAYYFEPSSELGKAHEYIGTLVKRPGRELRVKTKTLTDIFMENKIERCDFMKVDIESAEWEIFENTPQEIINRVDRYVVEIDARNGKSTNTEEFLHVLGDQFVDISKEVFPKWCAPGNLVHGAYINKRVL